MLVINPDECIDCGVCEPECPIDAIKPDSDKDTHTWQNGCCLIKSFLHRPNISKDCRKIMKIQNRNKYEEHFSDKPGK